MRLLGETGRGLALATAVTMATGLATTAVKGQAATDAAAPATGADAQQYTDAVERGVTEFGAGNWQEAYINFSYAYELRPGPRPLRGMGMALYEQRRYAEAVDALERALTMEDAEAPLTADMVESTESLLTTARKYVAKLMVTVRPEGATLQIDGREVQPGTSYVDGGEHELVAVFEGHREVREVNVRLGEQLEVDLEVRPQSASIAVATPAPAKRSPQLNTGAVAAFSVGGAGLLTMAIFGTLALQEHSRLAGECKPRCTDGEVSTLDTYNVVADVGLGVGVLGAAVGFWLWQFSDGDETATSVSPVFGPDGVGVVARGSL